MNDSRGDVNNNAAIYKYLREHLSSSKIGSRSGCSRAGSITDTYGRKVVQNRHLVCFTV